MKKISSFYLAAILLAIVVFKESCNDSKAGSPPKKRTLIDTAQVVAVYVSRDRKSVLHDLIWRVRYDSVQLAVPMGDQEFKLKWGVDTAYFVPRQDTLRDANNKPVYDSTGKVKFVLNSYPIEKNLVWDTNMTTDSAIKKFKGFLAVDTAKKNPN